MTQANPVTFLGDGIIIGDEDFKRAYDAVVAYCAQVAAAIGTEPVHAPMLLPLSAVRDAGYASNFPQHLFTCRPLLDEIAQPAEDYVMSPAACLSVFAMLRGSRLSAPRRHNILASCGRYEEGHSTDPNRLACYTVYEIVCVADRLSVNSFFKRAHDVLHRLLSIFPLGQIVVANDAFFGTDSTVKEAYQHRVRVKFEFQVPVSGRRLAIASINAHGQVFGNGFDIQFGGQAAFSACFGMGLERATQYALHTLGSDTDTWPTLELGEGR